MVISKYRMLARNPMLRALVGSTHVRLQVAMLPACIDASEAVPRHGANEIELQKRGDGSNQGAQNEPDAPCTPDCVSTAALGARD